MFEVNRSIALLRPQAPFLTWLKSLPGGIDPQLTLDALSTDCNALLIPPAEDADDARRFVQQRYRQLFEAELADWCEDESLWPQNISPNLFQQWFRVEIHSVLTDLVEEPLEREAFAPLDLDGRAE
ncbi:VacJ [Chromobacterium violaceum]|uniref:VacJ n=1 Tax=Chromobacterium violaceum TaxID=536 RepID=A0A202BFJ1_CHRVL|nr:VacJ [Chromobacterium violaceum]OQS11008.1 VacJ [Chromobacterium violaceum]OQS30184.1 VacJ [Chromobacterium violaceum]OVE50160.1 VacJ [Chromobacterium violaceum]